MAIARSTGYLVHRVHNRKLKPLDVTHNAYDTDDDAVISAVHGRGQSARRVLRGILAGIEVDGAVNDGVGREMISRSSMRCITTSRARTSFCPSAPRTRGRVSAGRGHSARALKKD